MGYAHFRFIESYVHQGRVGVLVEFGVESDFATRTPEFREFAKNIAMHIAALDPSDVEALFQQQFALDDSRTVAEVIEEAHQLLKESIVIRRFIRWDDAA